MMFKVLSVAALATHVQANSGPPACSQADVNAMSYSPGATDCMVKVGQGKVTVANMYTCIYEAEGIPEVCSTCLDEERLGALVISCVEPGSGKAADEAESSSESSSDTGDESTVPEPTAAPKPLGPPACSQADVDAMSYSPGATDCMVKVGQGKVTVANMYTCIYEAEGIPEVCSTCLDEERLGALVISCVEPGSGKAADEADEADEADLFNLFDSDGGGTISPDEMATVVKEMGWDISAEELDALIAEIDEDGSGEIDFEEFTAMMVLAKLAADEADESSSSGNSTEVTFSDNGATSLGLSTAAIAVSCLVAF